MDYRQGNNSHKVFYLTGFTNLGEHRRLLFIPFFLILLYMMTANAIVTFAIASQRKLYQPMYLLIGSLTLLNFFYPLFFVPRMIISFLSGRNEITKGECLFQVFLIHFGGSFQGSILLQMAVDRFFAICWPLHYHNIVNLRNSIIFSVFLAFRNTVTMVVMVGLFIPLSFCHTDVIYHCLCVETSIITLACGNVAPNYVADAAVFTLTTSDCILISATYVVIFIVIFRTPSGESRQKAIHTCGTHLIVIYVAYMSVVCAFVGHRVSTLPADIRVLMSLIYLLTPCSFSPVIYGIRTKEIKVHVIKLLKLNKVGSQKTQRSLQS